jgi:hypothetical protein
MNKNTPKRVLQQAKRSAAIRTSQLSPDSLKDLVRDVLISMSTAQREDFAYTLEKELEAAGLDFRSYLIPLGIPARSPAELTPIEVGHLIRFLKIIVPASLPAIERSLGRFGAFADEITRRFDRQAA